MDDYREPKEIIEKQAALNQKLAAMALELDSERAKNAKLCKEISCLKSLIGESGQELWSAENQRADRLENELGQVKRERDVAKERLAAYENLGPVDYLRKLVQAEQNEEANTTPKFVWHIGETQGVHRVPYRKSLEKYLGIKFWLTREEAEAALKGGAE